MPMIKAQYETQLKYRRMDEDGDMVFGRGEQDFMSDIEAITQVIKTRLAAMEGEWWEGDIGALPYFTDILGMASTEENRAVVDLMIINRIMDTVGVLSVSEVESSIENRHYRFNCKVQTVYGETTAEVIA